MLVHQQLGEGMKRVKITERETSQTKGIKDREAATRRLGAESAATPTQNELSLHTVVLTG